MSRFPLGSVEQQGKAYTLDFEREYPFSAETIWAALTRPELTAQWWAEAEIDLRVGEVFRLRWLNSKDGEAQHWTGGEITALEPLQLLEHTNSDHGMLRWHLEERDGSTVLTLTNVVTPPERRFVTMSLAGWHVHLDHLQEALEGGTIDWPNWYPDYESAWAELREIYADINGLP